MTFGFQPLHLVVILVIALVVFGPHRLPEIGRLLGRAIIEFRKGTREFTDSFQDGMRSSSQPENGASLIRPVWQPGGQGTGSNRQFCIHCGAPNPLDARFCNRCGKQLPGNDASEDRS